MPDIEKIHKFYLKKHPDKGITVLEDVDGWFYTTGAVKEYLESSGVNNLFFSIQELSLVVNQELVLIKSIEVE